jgi:tetratricopeptide (TPR) repeat protein
MKRQLGILTSLLLGLCISSFAQLSQRSSKPCRIRINVTDDRQNKIRDLTVELQDSLGLAAAGTSKLTDSDGRVEFNSYSGRAYRLRITGAEIEPYEGDFEISPSESIHTENIRVRMKPAVGGENTAPGPPVPSVRLKIPPQAQKEYDRGNKAAEKGDWKSAGDSYRAAIQLYPDFDQAYNGLGIALSSQGDNAGAKQAFEKALSITPEYAMAGRNLARILLAEHDWKRSDEILRKSLQTEPVNAWALTNAAYAELQLRDFQAAAANAQKVHQVPHTGFENAHYIAALALEELHQPDQARAEYELYLKEAPTGSNAVRAHEALARLSKP